MSGRADKQARREIRRAMGTEGLNAVNGLGAVVHQTIVPTVDALFETVQRQAKALDEHTGEIVEILGRQEQDAGRIDSHRRILADHTEQIDELRIDVQKLQQAPPHTTFAQRLRWLVSGATT